MGLMNSQHDFVPVYCTWVLFYLVVSCNSNLNNVQCMNLFLQKISEVTVH